MPLILLVLLLERFVWDEEGGLEHVAGAKVHLASLGFRAKEGLHVLLDRAKARGVHSLVEGNVEGIPELGALLRG